VLGHFTVGGGDPQDAPFIDAESPPDPDRTYPNLAGDKPSWHVIRSERNEVSLSNVFNTNRSGSTYAVTWIRADRPRRVMLEFGVDDSARIWLNDERVWDRRTNHGMAPAQYHTPLDLRPGWNRLTIKVTNDGGPYGLVAELVEHGGRGPAEGLVVHPTPPDQQP